MDTVHIFQIVQVAKRKLQIEPGWSWLEMGKEHFLQFLGQVRLGGVGPRGNFAKSSMTMG